MSELVRRAITSDVSPLCWFCIRYSSITGVPAEERIKNTPPLKDKGQCDAIHDPDTAVFEYGSLSQQLEQYFDLIKKKSNKPKKIKPDILTVKADRPCKVFVVNDQGDRERIKYGQKNIYQERF